MMIKSVAFVLGSVDHGAGIIQMSDVIYNFVRYRDYRRISNCVVLKFQFLIQTTFKK